MSGSFEQSVAELTVFAKHTGRWRFPWYYNLVHADSERLGERLFIVHVINFHDMNKFLILSSLYTFFLFYIWMVVIIEENPESICH